MTTVGQVESLWVFPVKSMSGAPVGAAQIAETGLVGDREWAVVDDAGETVTAKHEPRLREAVARLDGGDLRIDLPDGHRGLTPEQAGPAMSRWLGRTVRLEHRSGSGFVDVAPVHLVSTSSITDAAHAEDCDACDVTEPRANLVVALADSAQSETGWVGRSVTVGASELVVAKRPKHCLGVYADVRSSGQVAVGDPVQLA